MTSEQKAKLVQQKLEEVVMIITDLIQETSTTRESIKHAHLLLSAQQCVASAMMEMSDFIDKRN